MISTNLLALFYLISGVLFILALRGLSSPETSRQGNFFGILGMLIAVVVTFLSIGNFSTSFVYVIAFLLIGGSIDPENVIAPTAAPIDISIKLASLILPEFPRLKASGFKKAEIATKTAAKPTRL